MGLSWFPLGTNERDGDPESHTCRRQKVWLTSYGIVALPTFQWGEWCRGDTRSLALGHKLSKWWVGIEADDCLTPEPATYHLGKPRRKEACTKDGELRQGS